MIWEVGKVKLAFDSGELGTEVLSFTSLRFVEESSWKLLLLWLWLWLYLLLAAIILMCRSELF